MPTIRLSVILPLCAAVTGLAACSADAPFAVSSPVATRLVPSVAAAVLPSAPLFYSTLDDMNAITHPAYGSGRTASLVAFPANSFVKAHLGMGVLMDANGERIAIPQIENGVQNIELDKGTMDFWYQPNFASDDDNKYTIAGTGNWTAIKPRGSWHFGKHNKSNLNKLFLIFFDANGVRYEHNVTVADYSWSAGDWQHVVITWNFAAKAGRQNLHLYLNDRELPLSHQVSYGPQPLPAEQPNQMVYIGSRGNGNINADGVYDEVRIYDRIVKPS
ncbi:MAG: LamG-like jellyroll fold domain-containing protein [Gemmatimonadota bacterium]